MSKLKTNTAQLEALLAKVNALPEAGSGGSNFDTITVRSGTEGFVNGITIYSDVDTEVPVSLSSLTGDVYPIFFNFIVYNVSTTFTVARTGESYTVEKSAGYFNISGGNLSFIPGDTIIISGISDI